MQTKSNLWAGATIWANLAIVFIIYAIAYAGASFVLPDFDPYFAAINPIVIVLLTVFAAWLGVRSVQKATPIEPQNFFAVSVYATTVPFIFQVILIVASVALGRANWWQASYLIQDLLVASLVYYFLSKDRKSKILSILVALVFIIVSIFQGYTVYKQNIELSVSAAGLQQIQDNLPNGNSKVDVTTTYTNTRVRFAITIPAGWYVPKADADPADFYSCPLSSCDDVLEISGSGGASPGQFSDIFDYQISKAQDNVKSNSSLSYQEMDGIVPGAKVIKEKLNQDYSSWQYSYDVMWPYKYPMADGSQLDSVFSVFIYASNDKITESLLPTLAISGKPE